MKEFALMVASALMVTFIIAFFGILIICFILKCRQRRNLDAMPLALQVISTTPNCDGHYAYVYYDTTNNEEFESGAHNKIVRYISTENITGYPHQWVTSPARYNLLANEVVIETQASDLLKKLDVLVHNLSDYFWLLKQQKHDLWYWPNEILQFGGNISPKSCKLISNTAKLDNLHNTLLSWMKDGNSILPLSTKEIPAAGLGLRTLQILVDNLENKTDKTKEYCRTWKAQEVRSCNSTETRSKLISQILKDPDFNKPSVNLCGLIDTRLMSRQLQEKMCNIARPILNAVGFTVYGLTENSIAFYWEHSTATVVPGSAFHICRQITSRKVVSCEEVVVAVLFSLFMLSLADYSM